MPPPSGRTPADTRSEVTPGLVTSRAYGLIPPLQDRDSAPFWDGLRTDELRLQRCLCCETYRFPARAVCNKCMSWETEWVVAGGTGTIFSWAVVHHALTPAYASLVPYTLLAVRLDEQDDLIVPGGLSGSDGQSLQVGAPVTVEFVTRENGVTFMAWSVDEADQLGRS